MQASRTVIAQAEVGGDRRSERAAGAVGFERKARVGDLVHAVRRRRGQSTTSPPPCRWPPLSSTARAPRARRACAASRIASQPAMRMAEQQFGFRQVRRDQSPAAAGARAAHRARRRPAASRPRSRPSPGRARPARAVMRLQRIGHGIVDHLRRRQHAQLDRADVEIVEAGVDLRAQERRRPARAPRVTPRVCCAVSAASADSPCTRCAAKVFRSAWMPAPPPESDPAMVRAGGAPRQSYSTSDA